MMSSLRIAAFAAAAIVAASAHAGEVLFEQSFGAGIKKPASFEQEVTLPLDQAPYILNLVKGDSSGAHRTSDASVSFAGQQVISPRDVSQNPQAVNKSIDVETATNDLSVTIRGKSDAFVVIRIVGGVSGSAPPPSGGFNATHTNADDSLSGYNLGNSIVIWFARETDAAEYVLFAASDAAGPWLELQRIPGSSLRPDVNPRTVDTGTPGPDGEPRGSTALFREQTTYYRMDALAADGSLIAEYPFVAVAAFIEERATSPPSTAFSPFASSAFAPNATSAPCSSPCVPDQSFIDDAELTDSGGNVACRHPKIPTGPWELSCR